MPRKNCIFLGDAESFYCSVEKAEHPEYQGLPLVVSGSIERRSGIILSACPIAKSFGVTTAERIGDALAKCPNLILVKPRMQTYINVSMAISKIYGSYTDLVEPFSIDEQFLDVTGSLHLFGSPVELAQLIQKQVMEETGIYIRFGISENKILAKTACDNFGKKHEKGIFTLSKDNLSETLWTLPITKMYMVGSKMTRHFESMGLDTIGKLAVTPLDKLKMMMRRKFGKKADVSAEMYWRIANGIDDSPVSPGTHQVAPKSVGHMMTLPRDFHKLEDVRIAILEMTELVCQRCREKGYMGHVVSVGLMGADFDRPSGFNRQMKMDDPTNITNQVYQAAIQLVLQHWDGYPIRKVGVSLSKLTPDDQYQVSLFDPDREKKMALEKVTDALKRKYGDSMIIRASSATAAGQAAERSLKIGGHYA